MSAEHYFVLYIPITMRIPFVTLYSTTTTQISRLLSVLVVCVVTN